MIDIVSGSPFNATEETSSFGSTISIDLANIAGGLQG